jgi:3-hydroxyisobutyrate dehydrogenase-like beta-hydroxyacid dehydrogenase
MKTIGLLHPGAMGSSIGAAAKASGREVYWVSESRSQATRERAEKAKLSDVGTLSNLVETCDFIVSVCPPAYAVEVARDVIAAGFNGVYLDANAISPGHSREIGEIMKSAGVEYIDGGIIGPPAWENGKTRLYLAGSRAGEASACFKGSPLDVIVLDGPAGAASALKMVFAAYAKGTTALLGAILAVAQHEGVREALMQEWSISFPQLADSVGLKVQRTTAKAWRFVGEMQEISSTFRSAGLPGEFHRGAEEVYRSQALFKDASELPTLEEVLSAMLARDTQ